MSSPCAGDDAVRYGRQSPCQGATTLAADAVAPAGGNPLRAGCWQPPLAGEPWVASCRQAASGPLRARRLYIPAFQIGMEKMKEVKRIPLLRYPHNGSLQRNSSNLISQLLRRGKEENKRWWLKSDTELAVSRYRQNSF
ncbi:hypothetical protein GW17_00037331 [Ensete ventricosum]|nr:hypothetical protein GW17_00037331 [Ensete ventricosum]